MSTISKELVPIALSSHAQGQCVPLLPHWANCRVYHAARPPSRVHHWLWYLGDPKRELSPAWPWPKIICSSEILCLNLLMIGVHRYANMSWYSLNSFVIFHKIMDSNVPVSRRHCRIGKVLDLGDLLFHPLRRTIWNLFSALEGFYHSMTGIAVEIETTFWTLATNCAYRMLGQQK